MQVRRLSGAVVVACAMFLLTIAPAPADTLRRVIELEDVPRAKLVFDNGDGEQQKLSSRPIKVTLKHPKFKIADTLCFEGAATDIKKFAKGLQFQLSVKVNADDGPLTLTDNALCSWSGEGLDLDCSIEDDGGRFRLEILGEGNDCPAFTMTIDAGDKVRVGSSGEGGGPAAYIKAPPSASVTLALE